MKPITLHRSPHPLTQGGAARGLHLMVRHLFRCANSDSSSRVSYQAPLCEVITTEQLQELAARAGARLDESAMAALCDIANDFVESVTRFASEIARHAQRRVVTAADVQLCLEQNWGIPRHFADRDGTSEVVDANVDMQQKE
jgi:histone H3/H4